MAARLSPDGKTAATGSIDTTIRLWNVESGELQRTLTGHRSWVNSLAFSPDGVRLLSGSSDGTLKVWRMDSGELLKTIAVTKAEVRSVAWSPDGGQVAAGIRYGKLGVWDTSEWKQTQEIEAHQGDVWGVAFAADGRLVSGSGDWRQPGEVRVWNTATGKLTDSWNTSEEELAVTTSQQGSVIAAGSTDGSVQVWDLASSNREPNMQDQAILEAVTFYASFDEELRGDFGGGKLEVATRYDHPEKKGEFVFEPGYDKSAFKIAPRKGIVGGALECTDVLPRRGRMFFAARGNIGFQPSGWSGSASMWLNGNPDTQLKTGYCDPFQFTHRGAHDGGLWADFPDTKPRGLRLGAYKALEAGEKAVPESDANAPTAFFPEVGFETGDWHHVVLTWKNLDTGQANADLQLFVDGQRVANLSDRNIGMQWDLDKTGLYFAVAYIGLFDELTLFRRDLTQQEISTLFKQPDLIATGHAKKKTR